jgi:hypothetical protein
MAAARGSPGHRSRLTGRLPLHHPANLGVGALTTSRAHVRRTCAHGTHECLATGELDADLTRVVARVGLVLVGFVVLQQLRLDPSESLAAVKECWQLTITRQGQPPLPLLKACPAHLRATA